MKVYRKALITGASSGIGAEIAKLLAKEKIPLFLTGRNETRLKDLAETLKPLTSVEIAVHDLSTQTTRQPLIEWIEQNSPDLVIQSAGFGLYGPINLQDSKELINMIDVNVSAVLEIAQAAAKTLIARNYPGTFLHVSSLAAVAIMPEFSVYSSTKACLLHLSQCLDFELKPFGIRVLSFCPGHVKTNFQSRAAQGSFSRDAPYSLDLEKTAQAAVWQIKQQKRVLFYDWRAKIIAFLCRYLLPTAWVAAFARTRSTPTPKRTP